MALLGSVTSTKMAAMMAILDFTKNSNLLKNEEIVNIFLLELQNMM